MVMKPELPIKSEELSEPDGDHELSPSLLNSFQTLPTDTQSAASGKHYGAPTLGSMNYTESQSAGQTGGSYANQEDTATREQMVVEEGNRREAVDPKEAGRNDDEDEVLLYRFDADRCCSIVGSCKQNPRILVVRIGV